MRTLQPPFIDGIQDPSPYYYAPLIQAMKLLNIDNGKTYGFTAIGTLIRAIDHLSIFRLANVRRSVRYRIRK